MYEHCGSWHNDNVNYVPIFDGCKIIVEENGKEKNLSINDINIKDKAFRFLKYSFRKLKI